jgi:hypothetical protein
LKHQKQGNSTLNSTFILPFNLTLTGQMIEKNIISTEVLKLANTVGGTY